MTDERWQVRLGAHGRDPDEALSTLAPFYSGREWSSSGDPKRYSYRYAAVGDGSMTLHTSRMQGSIRGEVPPSDQIVTQWIVSGRASVDVGRAEMPMVAGRPQLFPDDRPFVFDYHDYDQKLVHLDRGLVAGIAAERGADPEALRFDHTAVPTAASTALWLDTVGLVTRAVGRGDMNPLLWKELSRMTAAAFLQLYPPVQDQRAAERPRPGRVAEATDFIDAHAHEPITPADVAAAVGISLRALQSGFQQVLGTSPAAHLRGVRLHRAHQELQVSSPARATVNGIARAWGFANPGRFSALYVQRYGRYPSETLAG